MAKSGYQRIKEYRDRQKTTEKLPTCKMCDSEALPAKRDRLIKGKLSLERGICSYCFPKTEEGQQKKKEVMERYYAKQRASIQQTLGSPEE